MEKPRYKLRGKVWVWPGEAAWHFVNVSKSASRDMRDNFGEAARGFGSLPVTVTVGSTSWNTSIFPDKKSGTYLLPLKAAARKSEDITEGRQISYLLTLRL